MVDVHSFQIDNLEAGGAPSKASRRRTLVAAAAGAAGAIGLLVLLASRSEVVKSAHGTASFRHGGPTSSRCLASAGYLWCDFNQSCGRPWEQPCPLGYTLANETPPHGGNATSPEHPGAANGSGNGTNSTGDCLLTAGFWWCPANQTCGQPWEKPCPGGYTPPKEQRHDDANNGGNGAEACLLTAGYSWCSANKTCGRPWEQPCPGGYTMLDGDAGGKPRPGAPDNGTPCLLSAGYSWCDANKTCGRPWEQPCPGGYAIVPEDAGNKTRGGSPAPPIGGGDPDACLATAGYSWCAANRTCGRPWEQPCPGGYAVRDGGAGHGTRPHHPGSNHTHGNHSRNHSWHHEHGNHSENGSWHHHEPGHWHGNHSGNGSWHHHEPGHGHGNHSGNGSWHHHEPGHEHGNHSGNGSWHHHEPGHWHGNHSGNGSWHHHEPGHWHGNHSGNSSGEGHHGHEHGHHHGNHSHHGEVYYAPNGKPFPKHWGAPPPIQTRDLRELPGGYGEGSSTLAEWIQENMDKDAEGHGHHHGNHSHGNHSHGNHSHGQVYYAPNGQAFPEHWGAPPEIQTDDYRELPGGYGEGSSTLAAWVQENMDKDVAQAEQPSAVVFV